MKKKNYEVKTYYKENEVIAVSRYAGKNIRAFAKCNPNDEFNKEFGEKLATARVNEKIAKKKLKNAIKAKTDALKEMEKAQMRYKNMCDYFNDATEQLKNCINKVSEIIDNI